MIDTPFIWFLFHLFNHTFGYSVGSMHWTMVKKSNRLTSERGMAVYNVSESNREGSLYFIEKSFLQLS